MPRLARADRKSLLIGTALASTLLTVSLLAPMPARALTLCAPGSGQILLNEADDIRCINVDDRSFAGTVIDLTTSGADNYIYLSNSGMLTANAAGGALGIDAYTGGDNSPIDIANVGDLNITSSGATAFGIMAVTNGGNSRLDIWNSGDLAVTSTASTAFGIVGETFNGNSPLRIENHGDLAITSTPGTAYGIRVQTYHGFSPIDIINSGDFAVTGATSAFGIRGRAIHSNSPFRIENSGDFAVTSTDNVAYGIQGQTYLGSNRLDIINSGDFAVTGANYALGIQGQAFYGNSPLRIENSGDFAVTSKGSVAFGIQGQTFAGLSPLDIINSGDLAVTGASVAAGIFGQTSNGFSRLLIENSGDFAVTSTGSLAVGIRGETFNGYSPLDIINSGDFTVTGASNAIGIQGETVNGSSQLLIENSGDFTVTSTGSVAYGIRALTFSGFSPLDIVNSGDFTVTGASTAVGIQGQTFTGSSQLLIENSGDLAITSTGSSAYGIQGLAFDGNSRLDIWNSGDFVVTGVDNVTGILGQAYGNAPLRIENRGAFTVTGLGSTHGIDAATSNGNSALDIWNSGDFFITSTGNRAYGIEAVTFHGNSAIGIVNSGDFTVIGADAVYGIDAVTLNGISAIGIENTGDVTLIGANTAIGIRGLASNGSPLDIETSGDLVVTSTGSTAFGIFGQTFNDNSRVSISNAGVVTAQSLTSNSTGIYAYTKGGNSPVDIKNSGPVFGGTRGVYSYSQTSTTLLNSGRIGAANNYAIDIDEAAGTIRNYGGGVITGFVDLTDNPDLFHNQAGGTFQARLTSSFGGGSDLFRNEAGGTVHALALNGVQPAFVGLERFENSGLISMANGSVGDVFTISNTVGGTDLTFQAGSGAVAVDAFLGPPGSTADNFVIDGNVLGQTQLIVNNTRPGGGAYNPDGIPVVFVPNGQVSGNAFYMPQAFDSGLFDWDVHFVPTGGGSGLFELRSFPGGGAHMLPQLLTAAQDIWHTTNETWFDRTADLRVLLNGGAVYGAEGGKLGAAQVPLTPGVWLKGSGTWLEQDDSATTSAYGRTYNYNLNRDLDVWNLEAGIDFGKRGVWAEGDALLFGILGGAILGSLDYDQLARRFDIEGGEVGGYVTYLNGGLFVDTLVKANFLD